MQQIFSNTTLTVNQLIEKRDTGELGLPELQRPFIWKDSKVRDLFDSMMRGYPIGYAHIEELKSSRLRYWRRLCYLGDLYNNPHFIIRSGGDTIWRPRG